MSLRDVEALGEWEARVDPPVSVSRIVRTWVQGLDGHSWQAPSRQFPEMSNLPEYEVRAAALPVARGLAVWIFYRTTFGSPDVVDLIHVHGPLEPAPAPSC